MKLKYLGAVSLAALSLTSTTYAVSSLAYQPLATLPGNDTPQGLAQGADGNFYGTTYYGGTSNKGYVFQVTPAGTTTILTNFTGANGANPWGPLVLGTNGLIYGLTREGGATDDGTIFSISTDGTVTTLHSGGYPQGVEPSDLILGKDGNFYGVTVLSLQGGNIFRFTHEGVYSVVKEIDFASAGYAGSSLIQDTNGNFYGATSLASTNNGGSLYKLSTNGTLSVLHAFQPGVSPRVAGVVNGTVYGYTEGGGTNNLGSFFKVGTNGVLTTIKSFSTATGYYLSELKLGADGYFYGTATSGGPFFGGVYFKLSTSGAMTPLIQLSNGQSGMTTVIRGSDGNYYGACWTIASSPTVGGVFKTIGSTFGTFSGIFLPPNGAGVNNSGFITLKMGSDYTFSGKLTIEGITYSFSGQLDSLKYGSFSINRPGGSLNGSLSFVYVDGAWVINGAISTSQWTAPFTIDRANFSATETTPKAGLYSMTLLANGDGTTAPGYGSSLQILVLTNGVVKVSGKLSDGEGVSQTTALSVHNEFPLYKNLYKGTGVVAGWITLTNTSTSRLQGDVFWSKKSAAGKYYPNGFTNTVSGVGSALR